MRRQLLWIATTGVLAAAAAAQTVDDLNGSWQLTATAFLRGGGPTRGEAVTECTFGGTATLNQDGASFSGPANLALTAGSILECPPVLFGTLSGEAGVGTVDMGMILDATDGVAEFTGTSQRGPGGSYAGSFLVTAGIFSGVNGTWAAFRGTPAAVDIPTLAEYGLAALAAMLLASAAFLLWRWRA